jgi:hypothetical protein
VKAPIIVRLSNVTSIDARPSCRGDCPSRIADARTAARRSPASARPPLPGPWWRRRHAARSFMLGRDEHGHPPGPRESRRG